VCKEDGTQIRRPTQNILCTILHVTLFLLSEWRDVITQESRLKYEIEFHCIINCITNKKPESNFWGFYVIFKKPKNLFFQTNVAALELIGIN